MPPADEPLTTDELPPTLDAPVTRTKKSPTNPVFPTIPGFVLEQELGRGGMGVVFAARQTALNRTVALKMLLHGELARPEHVQRFLNESRAIARLRHPHIVAIHEAGEHGGRPYLTLEFITGGSLRNKLTQRLDARQVAQVVERLALAMAYAHERGIVHRDLKPDNVLLELADADDANSIPGLGVPKITDFGLARTTSGNGITATDAVLGTPSYMAPEQAEGKARGAGPAADIWGLGAILYALLAGRPPFEAATPWMTVLQVINDPPPPLTAIQPKIPKDLITICLRCLSKKPTDRYPSAKALAEELRRFLADERIEPLPTRRSIYQWLILALALILWTFIFAIGVSIGWFYQFTIQMPDQIITNRPPSIPSLGQLDPALEPVKGILKPEQADKYRNRIATFIFKVESAGYSKDNGTLFLNSMVERNERENFTVVIRRAVGEQLGQVNFDNMMHYYAGKRIRVRGKIISYNDRPQIELDTITNLTLADE